VSATAVATAVVPPVESSPRPRRHPLRAVLLALPPALITLAIGGYRAGDRQLWEDEYATWSAATLGHADFVRLIGHVDFALAPYYLLMHGWITLFGDSALALRAPSVIAMALASGLLVLLGRRLFNAGVGVIAGLLFGAVPSISRYAEEARPYALAMLLALLATLLLLRAIDRPTWPRWLLYGVVLVLLGLAHIVALSILAAHLLLVRQTARDRDLLRLWRWLGPIVMTISLVGPFALSASGQSAAIDWIKADRPTLRAFPGQLFGSAVIAGVLVGLAIIGIYLLVRTPGAQLPMLTAWALFPLVITFLTFPVLHLFEYRYLLFTVAAWVLLAAAGIDAIGRAIARRGALAVTLIAIVALPGIGWLSLSGQRDVRHDPVIGYPDYRQAAQTINGDLRPGDAIAYGGLYFRARRGMTYEMRYLLRPRDVFLYRSAEQLGGYVAKECPVPASCLGTTTRIWLVNTTQSADVFSELPPLTSALLRERCTVVDEEDFQHLHLVLLTVNPAAETDQSDPGEH
jgi:mannosyltransferase